MREDTTQNLHEKRVRDELLNYTETVFGSINHKYTEWNTGLLNKEQDHKKPQDECIMGFL